MKSNIYFLSIFIENSIRLVQSKRDTMAKGQDNQKNVKKEATKTTKEKKAAKKEKKAAKSSSI